MMTSPSPQTTQAPRPTSHRRRLSPRPMRLATTPFPRKAADTTRKPTAEKIRTAATSRQHSRHNHPRRPRRCPFDPTVVQPVPQVAVQTPGIADGDDGIDAANPVSSGIAAIPQNNGSPVTQAPSANKNPAGSQPVGDGPADPRTSSQPTPVDDGTDPVPQSPAPIQVSAAAGDDGTDVANGNSSNGAVNGKDNGPAARNKIGDGKPAANTSIGSKTAGKQPIDPNAASQIVPAMDDDAEPAAQIGIGTPPPANSTDQTASAAGGDAGTLGRVANAVQVPVQRPAAKDTIQADKPVQTASNIANGPQPITTPAPRPRHHRGWQKPATGRQPHAGGIEQSIPTASRYTRPMRRRNRTRLCPLSMPRRRRTARRRA